MTGWLIEHISIMDRAIARHIKQQQSPNAGEKP
jgi:hemerythrin